MTKYCQDCFHFRAPENAKLDPSNKKFGRCAREKAGDGYAMIAPEFELEGLQFCRLERQHGACGMEGKFFEMFVREA